MRTDHALVSVQLTSDTSPVIGPGRTLFPLTLIKDKKLSKAIKRRGIEATRELADLQNSGSRTETANAQTILRRFKLDTMKLARAREREVIPRLLAEIRLAEAALRKVKAGRDIEEKDKAAEAAALTKQIHQLKLRRFGQQQQNSRATHRLYGDRPTKYWSKLHRECAPRDVITAFEKEGQLGVSGEKTYKTDSTRMAAMARSHHMKIQQDGPETQPANAREHDIVTALASLDAKVSTAQAAMLGDKITYSGCILTL